MKHNFNPRSDCARVHGPNWLKWLHHLIGAKNVHGMEIGTFEGDSAEFMLDHVFTGNHSTYTCVDPFTGAPDHEYKKIDCSHIEATTRAKLARFAQRCIIIKMESHLAMHKMAPGQLDFIYVDGNHTARSVIRDAVMGFELLKIGGTMVFDDYNWKVMPHYLDRPKPAIDAFMTLYERQISVVALGWQVAVRKIAA